MTNKNNFALACVAQNIFDDNGKRLNIDVLLNRDMKNVWRQATTNKLGRLSEEIAVKVKGSKVVRWIYKNEIPTHKKITYANMVCNY